jgi:hypothetical protein
VLLPGQHPHLMILFAIALGLSLALVVLETGWTAALFAVMSLR